MGDGRKRGGMGNCSSAPMGPMGTKELRAEDAEQQIAEQHSKQRPDYTGAPLHVRVQSLDAEATVRVLCDEPVWPSLQRELKDEWGNGRLLQVRYGGDDVTRYGRKNLISTQHGEIDTEASGSTWEELGVEEDALVQVHWKPATGMKDDSIRGAVEIWLQGYTYSGSLRHYSREKLCKDFGEIGDWNVSEV